MHPEHGITNYGEIVNDLEIERDDWKAHAERAEAEAAELRAQLDAARAALKSTRAREAAAKRQHNQYAASMESRVNDLRNNGCPHCGNKITLPAAAAPDSKEARP